VITLNLEKIALVKNDLPPDNISKAINETISKNNVSTIVVASHKGKSAIKIAESMKGIKVVSVTEFTYSDKVKKRMKKLKMIPVEKVELPIQDDIKLRNDILQYGSGVKAALEVAAIAIQNGLVEDPFVALGGKGLRTALLLDIAESIEKMSVKSVISL
jgi:hypothetical protein